ncbi:MAG: glycosyltransferase family 4 protein, partial [Clostridiales bacterium]|nr:glycosyltransferase family 4 protein [Clostridiales bacterium]
RQWVDLYFGEYDVPKYECNSISYRLLARNKNLLINKSYNEYTGASGDVFHFLHIVTVPGNLCGKAVVTVHDMLPLRFPEYYADDADLHNNFSVDVKHLQNIQPTIIADSLSTMNDIMYFTGISADKIHVIPLAYDQDICFSKKEPNVIKALGIHVPYMLYIGAIDQRKNIVRMVDAFCVAEEHFPGIKLVLAGVPDSNAKETLSMINSKFYQSRIIMTGYVSDNEKRALYSGAIGFLFPSLFEGFGLPILEAMACGCPVITSDVSSMPEVAGKAAVLVDPYSVEQLAWEMERLIHSEMLREELIRKGYEQCAKFSWDRTAEMTEDVYRRAYNE